MHLLLIHEIFVTPDEGGGTRHYELAKYLVTKGHKVTVIASDIDYLSGKKRKKRREIKEGIEIIYSKTIFPVHKSFIHRALAFLSFSFFSFLDGLKVQDIDIVMGTSPPLFQALTSLLIAKLKKKPFVYEVRDLWLDFARELGVVKNKYIISILKLVERIIYKSSDRIIVNSPGFIPFVKSKVSEDRIFLIPNGVSTKDFNIEENEILDYKRKLKLENKFVVMYAGNIGVANDIFTILESAVQLKDHNDIVFVLVGGGIKKKEAINYVKGKGIDNVIFLDIFPKKDMPKILGLTDVCLATLKNTPLLTTVYPNKVFDYMAAGKPTILAMDGVIKEVIEKSNGGFCVTPGNSKEIAEAILKYYNNKKLCEIHGKNAKEYVKKYFEREKIAEDFEKLLLELL